jgi:tRNA dimethylallyltransferase
MKNIICVISGPTASGKTSTSISLAKKFGGEIVNFDSLLFYKEITIGTAKPTEEEKDGVPHHFVNCESVNNPINAADFSKLAISKINELHSQKKIVYLVGGSGFYLQAVLKGMYDSQTTPTSHRHVREHPTSKVELNMCTVSLTPINARLASQH